MKNEISQHWTLDEEKLAAFVLKKIDEKEISVLAAHLDTCDECRKRVQEEREILTGIRRYGRMEMKRKLKMRLRRDQKRRFEWINAASIAAAIVIMLGGVFAVRWFIDFNQEKTITREILLSEYKETQPGERSLWIIGKIIEVNEISESRKSAAFADKIKIDALSEKDPLLGETISRGKKELEIADTTLQTSRSDYIAAADQELSGKGQENAIASAPASAPAPSVLQKESKTGVDDKALARVGSESLSKISEKPAATREYPAAIAETKLDEQEVVSKKRKSVYTSRQRRSVKNVIVRRGDMKDLPASLSSGDVTAIHTRMERIDQGILLTFYSNSIKDTVAANVEAITKDSIIVTFRKKQIVYHIPGGIDGGM